jgi:hypothetical protein
MAYVPDWERLSDALKRVVAAGVSEDEGKLDISRAIADRKIRARLTVAIEPDALTTWHQAVAKAQGLVTGSNHIGDPVDYFEGGNIDVPRYLIAGDFDWQDSRPLKSWPVRPRGGRFNEWRAFSRPALRIELRAADVRKVLCGEQTPAATEIKRPKRGRPPEYNWDGVKTRIAAYVSRYGPMQTLTELLQKCSDFASELHGRKSTPDDKTVRDAIKTHGLDIAAGLAPGNSPGN